MKRSAIGIVIAALAPAAQAAVTFPENLDVRTLSAWLGQETDLRPEQVVAVSQTSVAAIVAGPEDRGGVKRVTVRSEAIDPGMADAGGPLSAQLDVYVDCAGHRVRQGASTGHDQRNLAGVGRILSQQDADWRVPLPGTQLESVWRAVCDASFESPLKLRLRPAATASEPPRPPATRPRPARAPSGRLRVQVGAFPTMDEANAAASALRQEFPQLMRERQTEVAAIEIGATAYYRVLVSGFSSLDQQVAYCGKLKAAGHDCFLRNIAARPTRPAQGRNPGR